MSAFLLKGLTESGHQVDLAESGASAEALTSEIDYDLIILDVMLPGQNGLDTAKHLRSQDFTGPILMLTALSGTPAKVAGLDAGADDYLTKPFDFDELLARIRALTRRSTSNSHQDILKFSDLELHVGSRKVIRDGQEISLTSKEYLFLEYLMKNPGRVLTRTQILERVWDIHFDNNSNVIDVYINMLRKKVDAPFNKKLIHTVVGAGYVLKES